MNRSKLTIISLCALATLVVCFNPPTVSAGPDTFVLSLSGICPGRLTVAWEGAPADRWMAIAFARQRGNVILSTPCGGTQLGLGSTGLRLVALIRTGPEGAGRVHGEARSEDCGGYVQLIAYGPRPCPTSNVVQIPQ